MSVLNTNTLNANNVSNNLANESNLNDTTQISENRQLNENILKAKAPKTTFTAITTITAAPTSVASTTIATMPAATNPTTATVTVLNSNTPFPSVSSDHCSDSEEDFDRTTKNLGAHKWIFNYKDVSSLNLEWSIVPNRTRCMMEK